VNKIFSSPEAARRDVFFDGMTIMSGWFGLSGNSESLIPGTLLSTGILLRRLPVAAKIALAMAGTIAEVPVSPIPPGGSALFST
jgi:hypothetical protein